MPASQQSYGIEGHKAPELNVAQWIDTNGDLTSDIKLKDLAGKFKVIYCFQSWCPGCHSQGLPALQQMVKALEGNDMVAFLAIQTVFEGFESNTFDKMRETQQSYELKIPFGHDIGDDSTRNISHTMYHYRSGGTPWFIFIDQNDQVVFNGFHLNTEKAIEYLTSL